LKQQLAEEQVVMLKNRLFCKALPKIFDLLDRLSDDLNESLREKVIDNDTRSMITSRRDKILGQVKLDMMAIYISTAEATARGHAKVTIEEKDKLLSSENATVENLVNAIQARQENIIKRAQYITNCKMSFFDETPAMLID
jgi:ElaB/YqjD/DUF883 family membrane-anchored ribosome-binding protein